MLSGRGQKRYGKKTEKFNVMRARAVEIWKKNGAI